MGSITCLKISGEWDSLNFKCKKSTIGAEFQGPLRLLTQAWYIYLVARRNILSTCGSEHTPYGKVMTILVNTVNYIALLERTSFSPDAFRRVVPKFCDINTGDFVSTNVLIDATNTLLFFAVAHILYDMPLGEKRRIRLTIARYYWIHDQMGLPRS